MSLNVNVSITLCALQDEVIGQWLIKRNVDGKDRQDFTFDQNFTIKPGAKIRASSDDVYKIMFATMYC